MRDRKEHARLRRYFSPALSSQGLRASEALLTEKIDWFMQHIIVPAATSGQPLEIYERLYTLNLDISSLLSFGNSLDTLKGNNKTALHGVKSFTTVIPLTVMIPILRYLPIDLIRKGFQGLRELEAVIRACLVAYRARVENEGLKSENRTLVYNLVTAADPEVRGSALTLDELVANSIIFLVGGTDTTTITMCYTLWELGRKPETRAKLRKELLGAFPDPEIAPTYDVTSKLVSRECLEGLLIRTTITLALKLY
jgi:cytochrome P450